MGMLLCRDYHQLARPPKYGIDGYAGKVLNAILGVIIVYGMVFVLVNLRRFISACLIRDPAKGV